jgi:hypothetical protein
MEKIKLNDDAQWKKVRGADYNYDYNLKTGFLARWGKTPRDNAAWSPIGPEILDCEISTICKGGCPYCYKSNTSNGKNMSLETFKKVLDSVNYMGNLLQVAFGLDATGESNPDLWAMCDYCRSKRVTPNGTVAIVEPNTAQKIATHFGAVAVSAHANFKDWKDVLANSIYNLNVAKNNAGKEATLRQINIHAVIAEETLEDTKNIIRLVGGAKDGVGDRRFAGLNAIVLLSLKQCGRAKEGDYHKLSDEKYEELLRFAKARNVRMGMDSCAGNRVRKVGQDLKLPLLNMLAEPCESTLVSAYVNVDGRYFPCSFCEKLFHGVNVLDGTSFAEAWNGHNDEINHFTKELVAHNRSCPVYDA